MTRIEHLDGLRGIAALWVLIGHCMILTGFFLPVIGQPDLGVDLFILLSGFLMVFQYQLRQGVEDWGARKTWISFWMRRFFRIAPLYYVLLAAALASGPMIHGDRVAIDSFLSRELPPAERYLDASYGNIFMHVTFLFGMVPSYAFRTPLPDWSIGLEMQFYAVFPFLVLLAQRISWHGVAILVSLAGVAAAIVLANAGISFPMPAFLPLKMHLFACGMLTAAVLGSGRSQLILTFCLIVTLAAIPIGGTQDWLHLVMREAVAVTFFALAHCRHIPAIRALSRLLATQPFRWLGELSFGVYLIHLLVMQPVAAAVIAEYGRELGSPLRFLLVLSVVAPIVYAMAFATYKFIEMPGQKWGKSLSRRPRPLSRRAALARAEEIAAP